LISELSHDDMEDWVLKDILMQLISFHESQTKSRIASFTLELLFVFSQYPLSASCNIDFLESSVSRITNDMIEEQQMQKYKHQNAAYEGD